MRTTTQQCDRCKHEITNVDNAGDRNRVAQGGINRVTYRVGKQETTADLCDACQTVAENILELTNALLWRAVNGQLTSYDIQYQEKPTPDA